ncbi:MAG: 2-oxoglutarate dehydrogenase E1 component [Chlamydiae bacterium]|nr:2-oxoglutarate dehydrogenase E1 component [Chlamydiota bacterium]
MVDSGNSSAFFGNLTYIEGLYQQYQLDPGSVDATWRCFFEGMEFSYSHPRVETAPQMAKEDLKAYLLVHAYRTYGHLGADINPLHPIHLEGVKELSYLSYGFTSQDLDKEVATFGLCVRPQAPLSELISALKKIYCGKMGIEYIGIVPAEVQQYIQKKIEPSLAIELSHEEKRLIFSYLKKSELFETFLHTKYVGQKRFSLEGAETLIPMLAALMDKGAEKGLEEMVLGMAHRGRLNVLANILNKSYAHIFHEFEDQYIPMMGEGTGDVKYHKGFSGGVDTHSGRKVHVTLSANPSHLESVDPVVEGWCKAQQERRGKGESVVLPILIHGDASVAGQGVVYETLQLSRLSGYATGGTLHIVINNQIGFTTMPVETRSTTYCTDIAKAFGCPIFHVNAEDPEVCVKTMLLAFELRQTFGCDVFIDLYSYRKYGHNEGDEPAFTQPLEYKLIRSKSSIRELFLHQLLQEGVLTRQEAEEEEKAFKQSLQEATTQIPPAAEEGPHENYYPHAEEIVSHPPQPRAEDILSFSERLAHCPEGFSLHPKIQRLFSDRHQAILADPNRACIDWAGAETLAFALLLTEGIPIRLSGQDCQRGTFSQRHAVWVDQNTAKKYFPLSHLKEGQAPFEVLNSPLSEYAVLGFELGYSLSYPKSLSLWEAQYGDFANTAQVIIDQYLSSSEQKWNLRTHLVMLLPHGYEGQGPEHSSARMERYLQLAAQGNWIIANCSLPAQYFHLLRRQAYLDPKKPLVVFAPKALLRHPMALSSLHDLTSTHFKEVIPDVSIEAPQKVLLCSGKVYYDLVQERGKRESKVSIVRVEQLYPFPKDALQKILISYPSTQIVWVQEEHKNMGAWEYIRPCLEEILPSGATLSYAGRPRSAATATGSHSLHKKQYQKMMEEAFA